MVTAGKIVAGFAVCVILVGCGTHPSGVPAARIEAVSAKKPTPVKLKVIASPVLSLPPGEVRDILAKAEGYAAVFNVEKTDELTSEAVTKSNDPRVQAAAYWARAMACTRYDLEYRTNKFEQQRQETIRQIARLHPEFLADELATWEVSLNLRYPEPDEARVEQMVRQARISFDGKAASDSPSAFRMGRTLQVAAYFYGERGNKEKRRQYAEEACHYMEIAAKGRPASYEYQAYYLTAVAEAEYMSELEPLGKRIAQTFDGKFPYPPVGTFGPLYTHVAALSIIDPARSNQLFKKYVEAHPADANLQYTWILEGHSDSNSDQKKDKADPGKEIKNWTDLIARMEKGVIPIRGTDLRVLASAYYKLASAQSQAGQLREALGTYEKLGAISPHYAMIHLNRAVLYYDLAEKEPDAARKRELLQQALKEAEEQMNYNYHGTAVKEARALYDQIQKDLSKK